jgi:hypothetical protein
LLCATKPTGSLPPPHASLYNHTQECLELHAHVHTYLCTHPQVHTCMSFQGATCGLMITFPTSPVSVTSCSYG